MELEVGMYVKDRIGNIDKIILVEYAEELRKKYPNHPSKSYWRDKILLSKKGYWITTKNIVKASYNIIDLIEEGDYVNGLKIDKKCEDRVVIYTNDEIIVWFDYQIKSIVTKEQFENIAYKI